MGNSHYNKIAKLNSSEIYKKIKAQTKNRKSIMDENHKLIEATYSKYYNIEKKDFGGFPCYNIERKLGSLRTSIFYLYGSGLCNEISKKQLAFINDIVAKTGMDLILPMYPLAPEHDCQDVYDMVLKAYHDSTSKDDVKKLIVIGEGTGAILALSLMLQVWKEGYMKPNKLILLSPAMDTEFFNVEFKKSMYDAIKNNKEDDGVYFSEGIQQFINDYWVKNYATRTEYTSPIYQISEMTDICDEILLISGSGDILNCYSRYFYDAAYEAMLNVSYFEYPGKGHMFYLDTKDKDAVHARKVIMDIMQGTREGILDKYMDEVKLRSAASKKYPAVFRDEISINYLKENKMKDDSKIVSNMTNYDYLKYCSKHRALDEETKLFLKQYPEGTVIFIGCSLDAMFERIDNGRVIWFNIDNPGIIPIRNMYVKNKLREKTIAKDIGNFDFVKSIKCEVKNGVLFIINDIVQKLKSEELKDLLDTLYEEFPGCFVMFNTMTSRAKAFNNFHNKSNETDYKKVRLCMDDPDKIVTNWNTRYRVVKDISIFEFLEFDKTMSPILKFQVNQAHMNKDYRIVKLRLGDEKYMIGINMME